jgi:hypothetical protein
MADFVHGLDPIDEAFRRMRRRSIVVFAILDILFVALIAPPWVASPPPLDITLANLAIFVTLPAVIFIGGMLAQRRLRRSLETVRSRVSEVGAVSFLYIVLTLDNGLLVQLPGNLATLSAFFESDGSRLRPSLREARKWASPFRVTRLFTLRARKEAPDLTALRDDLGAGLAAATMGRCKSKGSEVEPHSPEWIATVVLGGGFGRRIRAERILDEADRIARYLQTLVQATLSRARSVPPPHA